MSVPRRPYSPHTNHAVPQGALHRRVPHRLWPPAWTRALCTLPQRHPTPGPSPTPPRRCRRRRLHHRPHQTQQYCAATHAHISTVGSCPPRHATATHARINFILQVQLAHGVLDGPRPRLRLRHQPPPHRPQLWRQPLLLAQPHDLLDRTHRTPTALRHRQQRGVGVRAEFRVNTGSGVRDLVAQTCCRVSTCKQQPQTWVQRRGAARLHTRHGDTCTHLDEVLHVLQLDASVVGL